MASRMKYWLLVSGAGMALLAAWLLPLEAFGPPQGRERLEAEIEYRTLAADLRWSSAALRRHSWSDSLSSLAASSEERLFVSAPSGQGITQAQLDAIESRMRVGTREVTRRDAELVIGFVLQSPNHGEPAGHPWNMRDRRETYAGLRNGTPFCLQVQTLGLDQMAKVVTSELDGTDPERVLRDPLAACRLYAQYGLPGIGVERWLASGGLAFAADHGAPRPVDSVVRGTRGLFGIASGTRRPLQVDHCLAGDVEVCEAIVLAPHLASSFADERQIATRSPRAALGEAQRPFLLFEERYMLADLEAEFGPEAFERFWESETDVAVAFQEAFGTEIGAWVVTWIESVAGIDSVGPGPPRSATLSTLLTITLLAGLSAGIQRRRRVV